MHFPPTHIYSIIPHPSARLSLSFPLPSLCITSCALKPLPTSTHPSYPMLTLSFSPPLSPLFLSIHTTESLLIICDLLKYIHCHSLSLPLSFLSPSLSLLPGLLFSNLLALLIPSLWVLSVSFVFLFCRIICATSPPPVPQRSHKHTLWDAASWCILCERVCWRKGMKPLHVAAESVHTDIRSFGKLRRVESQASCMKTSCTQVFWI